MKIKLDGIKKPYEPKDTDEVSCEIHNFVTTWGKLNAIQRVALAEGIDTTPDLPCLMASR